MEEREREKDSDLHQSQGATSPLLVTSTNACTRCLNPSILFLWALGSGINHDWYIYPLDRFPLEDTLNLEQRKTGSSVVCVCMLDDRPSSSTCL